MECIFRWLFCFDTTRVGGKYTLVSHFLFELVGLAYAKKGPKAPAFSRIFKMSGLVANLEDATSKQFPVSHTEERRRS